MTYKATATARLDRGEWDRIRKAMRVRPFMLVTWDGRWSVLARLLQDLAVGREVVLEQACDGWRCVRGDR